MGICILKKLFVLPTAETREYFDHLFQSYHLEIDFDALAVELGSTTGDIRVKESALYRAVPGSMNVWYDPAIGQSNLILPLFPSKEMASRHKEIGDAWGRTTFVPYMVIGEDRPLLKRRRKAILNSLSTVLVDTTPTFWFGNETVVEDNSRYPANMGFYNDYLSKGPLSNQVLIDDEEDTE